MWSGNEPNIPKLIIKVDYNPLLLIYHLGTDFLESFAIWNSTETNLTTSLLRFANRMIEAFAK